MADPEITINTIHTIIALSSGTLAALLTYIFGVVALKDKMTKKIEAVSQR